MELTDSRDRVDRRVLVRAEVVDEAESRHVTWLELHQDIDVTVRAEVVAEC